MPVARAPKGLDDAGRRLWRQVQAAVAPGWDLDERDLAVLEQAARHADLIAKLEGSIASDGLTVQGAAGQERLNAAVTALNVARGVLARLLAQVEIRPPQERTGRMSSRQRNQARDRVQEQRRRHGS
jgi:phage terminase small subunit